MADSTGGIEEILTKKLGELRPHLNERQWRLLLAAEARALGHGGIALIARVTGASPDMVRRGIRQLAGRAVAVRTDRVRRLGGGRKRAEEVAPAVAAALDELVDPPRAEISARRPLRWTTQSTARLAVALGARGHVVSPRTVARMLKDTGYRLQYDASAGLRAKDRDAQFGYVAEEAGQWTAGQPVVGLDIERRQLRPPATGTDAPAADWSRTEWDDDTAVFAVATLRLWWERAGRHANPAASRMLLGIGATASAGAEGRLRVWERQLAAFAAQASLTVTVCHLPDGTRKWTGVRQRTIATLHVNWHGGPLIAHHVTVVPVAGTAVEFDPRAISDPPDDADSLPLARHVFHGDWNYTIDHRHYWRS
ncbi:ISAzo13-like element transposase-related protein [Sphaerisporangium aureirubrum]|uniref:ISAzo13-like element transposase-related protein n=1 Tax=Sphaerisporangium aureirubrum TaxID=1544736 RepID=UPI0036333F61